MKGKITDSLILLLSIALVGIPTVMMLPDRAVTWPDLARTILWAAVIYALRQLAIAVITLRRIPSRKKPRPRLSAPHPLEGSTHHG